MKKTKTIMKKSLVIIALLFGIITSYGKNKTNSIEIKNAKKVKVEFKHVKKGNTLTIKSSNGEIVFKKEIENSGNFSKVFDFSNLEDGEYITELNKDFEILEKPFYLKKGIVTFLNNNESKIFKPVIRKENNKILISKITFDKDPLHVILYYKNEVIFSETLKNKEMINRVYKVSEKEKGNYKVVIYSNNRQYIKGFII